MKNLTIYDIKRMSEQTSPFYFTPKTLKFFGQTIGSFKVYKQKESGKYLISAPIKIDGRIIGYSERLFNPITNELEYLPINK